MESSSLRWSRILASLFMLVSASSAAFICDPSTCLNGTNGLSAGASLPSVQLLPGVYTSSSAPLSQTNGSVSAAVISNAVASTGFSVRPSTGGMAVAQLPGIALYPMQAYQGAANFTPPSTSPSTSNSSTVSFTSTTSNFAAASLYTNGTLSFLLSSGLRAILHVPTQSGATNRIAAYDSVADVTQWGFGAIGGLTVESVEGDNCQGGCGVGGICSVTGTCACATGFSGPRCDSCAPGFFGSSCTACSACDDGTKCDDTVTGSGQCLSPPTSFNVPLALATCNCLNGVCNGSKSCTCSPGWTDSTNGTRCATCAAGFFQDSDGECVACSAGCLQCSSPLGTCQSCSAGLQISKVDTTACEPAPFTLAASATSINACSSGFFNANNTSCQPCDPACATCSSAGPTGCTKCQAGRGLFASGSTGNTSIAACVNVDSSSGVCSNPKSSTGTAPQGLFLFNTDKGLCDAAPRFCTDATSSGGNSSSVTCTACSDGAFLSNGRCLTICPSGTFASDGSCVACDESCGTCDGSSSSCTSCKDPSQSLNAGQCVGSCPSGTFPSTSQSNGTSILAGTKLCLPCSSSCGTCEGSPTSCTSCPNSHPVLDTTAKTCSTSCPARTSFFDPSSSACKSCDASCASCSGATSGDCLSCPVGNVLQAGKCILANCAGNRTTVAGFGVCLETLLAVSVPAKVESQARRRFPLFGILLLILGIVLLLAAALVYWRYQQVKKRQTKTEKFANEVYNRSTDLKLKELSLSSEPIQNPPPTFAVPLPPPRPERPRETMLPNEKVLAWSRSGSPASSRPSSTYSSDHVQPTSSHEAHLRPSPSRHARAVPGFGLTPQRSYVAERHLTGASSLGSHYATESQVEAASLHRSVSERLAAFANARPAQVVRQPTGGSTELASNNPFRR